MVQSAKRIPNNRGASASASSKNSQGDVFAKPLKINLSSAVELNPLILRLRILIKLDSERFERFRKISQFLDSNHIDPGKLTNNEITQIEKDIVTGTSDFIDNKKANGKKATRKNLASNQENIALIG